jgi:hypothetical protein
MNNPSGRDTPGSARAGNAAAVVQHGDSRSSIRNSEEISDAEIMNPQRSQELDFRIAVHESGHILTGRIFGFPICLATIDPGDGYSGMVSASGDLSLLSSADRVFDLIDRVRPAMPQPGQPRFDAAEFYTHSHFRIIELLAGSEAERIVFDFEPLIARHDLEEAKSFASILCSSAESIDAFIEYARSEARALLNKHRHILLALAKELVERRTLTGAEIESIIAAAPERARRADWAGVMERAEGFASGSAI